MLCKLSIAFKMTYSCYFSSGENLDYYNRNSVIVLIIGQMFLFNIHCLLRQRRKVTSLRILNISFLTVTFPGLEPFN